MISVETTLTKGHGVASGTSNSSPFTEGTIKMQKVMLHENGIDLKGCYLGTLNLDTSPYTVIHSKPQTTINDVLWCKGWPTETFYLSPCDVSYGRQAHSGFLYTVAATSRMAHHHPKNVLEVISKPITDLFIGAKLTLQIKDEFADIMIYDKN